MRPFSQDELARGEAQEAFRVLDSSTIVAVAPPCSNAYKAANGNVVRFAMDAAGTSPTLRSNASSTPLSAAMQVQFYAHL